MHSMEQLKKHAEGHLDGDEFARMVCTVDKNCSVLITTVLLELQKLDIAAFMRGLTDLPRFKPFWELLNELLDHILRFGE